MSLVSLRVFERNTSQSQTETNLSPVLKLNIFNKLYTNISKIHFNFEKFTWGKVWCSSDIRYESECITNQAMESDDVFISWLDGLSSFRQSADLLPQGRLTSDAATFPRVSVHHQTSAWVTRAVLCCRSRISGIFRPKRDVSIVHFFSSIEIVLDDFISLFSIPKLRTDTDTHDCTLSETSVFILQSFIILPFGTVMVVYGLSQ